jgi:hypothetical protein
MAKKSAKKKKSGKKPVGGSAALAPRDFIIIATLLAAVAAVVFFLGKLFGPGALMKYFSAIVSGLVAGLSGNPVFAGTIQGVAARFDLSGLPTEYFPTVYLREYFSTELIYVIFAALMVAVTIRDSFKGGRLRYESALLVPVTALPGMALALWAKGSAALFRDLTAGLFESPWLVGGIAALALLLGIVRWAARGEQAPRHWALSIAVGPFAGFWVGYLDRYWIPALIVILYFTYLFVLNESESATISSLPIAFLPVACAKIFFMQASGAGALLPVGVAGISWPIVGAALAGFAASSLFAARLMHALSAPARRAIFFCAYIVFFVSLMFNPG